ncbi:hypothetical protein GCM10022234_00190 [Aeromicrobium panaciterrae]|uniref:hypothetical protein n=1 Tax=Aeromicrobium panaciterrae TaxID=363861 RepID=UPI0031D8F76E
MSRALATTVILPDPDTGEARVFLAGTVPDEWAADLITNPKAWGEGVKPAVDEESDQDADDTYEDDSQDESEQDESDDESDTDEEEDESDQDPDANESDKESDDSEVELVEPPRTGEGSGVKAWRAYATAKNVSFPEDAKRDEIIAAVDAASNN